MRLYVIKVFQRRIYADTEALDLERLFMFGVTYSRGTKRLSTYSYLTYPLLF